MRANLMLGLLVLVLVVWGFLVYSGFNAYQTIEASGSGFTRGSNRVSAFLQWQGLALLAGVAASIIGRAAKMTGAVRYVARLPLFLSGGFFAFLIFIFVAMLIWSRF